MRALAFVLALATAAGAQDCAISIKNADVNGKFYANVCMDREGRSLNGNQVPPHWINNAPGDEHTVYAPGVKPRKDGAPRITGHKGVTTGDIEVNGEGSSVIVTGPGVWNQDLTDGGRNTVVVRDVHTAGQANSVILGEPADVRVQHGADGSVHTTVVPRRRKKTAAVSTSGCGNQTIVGNGNTVVSTNNCNAE